MQYLVVPAGGVEGIGAACKESLVIARNQNLDVVVALVLHAHTDTHIQTQCHYRVFIVATKEGGARKQEVGGANSRCSSLGLGTWPHPANATSASETCTGDRWTAGESHDQVWPRPLTPERASRKQEVTNRIWTLSTDQLRAEGLRGQVEEEHMIPGRQWSSGRVRECV